MTKLLTALTLLVLITSVHADNTQSTWQVLGSGMELGTFAAPHPTDIGDSKIQIVRIDPKVWELVLVSRSEYGGDNRTARQWGEQYGLSAVTNAGMFATDYLTHVGYSRSSDHVDSERVNHYQSVAAFGPKDPTLPAFRIFDLDKPGVTVEQLKTQYASLVQNLRLIKRPGENRWSQQTKRWSEAALGEDRHGRILFIFCRSPFTMHDFNNALLALDIELVAAQHLEGGPEAQLFLQLDDFTFEQFGSYETTFREHDDNTVSWPIPNVLGVQPLKP